MNHRPSLLICCRHLAASCRRHLRRRPHEMCRASLACVAAAGRASVSGGSASEQGNAIMAARLQAWQGSGSRCGHVVPFPLGRAHRCSIAHRGKLATALDHGRRSMGGVLGGGTMLRHTVHPRQNMLTWWCSLGGVQGGGSADETGLAAGLQGTFACPEGSAMMARKRKQTQSTAMPSERCHRYPPSDATRV